jgi:Proteasome assembly chaperone 4
MKPTSSNFKSHIFTGEVAGSQVNFRVLQMLDSDFIYIGLKGDESLNGLSIGMETIQHKEAIATSIIESPESQDIAQKLAARLGKPVFVSLGNINLDRISLPAIEKHLIQEIKDKPEFF